MKSCLALLLATICFVAQAEAAIISLREIPQDIENYPFMGIEAAEEPGKWGRPGAIINPVAGTKLETVSFAVMGLDHEYFVQFESVEEFAPFNLGIDIHDSIDGFLANPRGNPGTGLITLMETDVPFSVTQFGPGLPDFLPLYIITADLSSLNLSYDNQFVVALRAEGDSSVIGNIIAMAEPEGGGLPDLVAGMLPQTFGEIAPAYLAMDENGFERWAVGVNVSIVPEPGTLGLLAAGAAAGMWLLRKRRQKERL